MSLTDAAYSPVEETIHGVLVSDPYRWLEDGSLPETGAWVREQQRRCDAYFAQCEAFPTIREHVRKYLDVDIVDQPAKVGGQYFYRRRSCGQEQGCLYVRDSVTGAERLIVDPCVEGPFVSVGIHRISDDGSFLAYERKDGGEDKKSIHIVEVETGVILPFFVRKGFARGFVFLKNNRGYIYCQDFSADDKHHKVRLQLFDESQMERTVFQIPRSRESRLTVFADNVHLGVVWVREVGGETSKDFWIAPFNDHLAWHQILADVRLPLTPFLKKGLLFAFSFEEVGKGGLLELNRDGLAVRRIGPEFNATFRQFAVSGERFLVLTQEGPDTQLNGFDLEGDEMSGIDLPSDGTARLLPDLGDGTCIFLGFESATKSPMIFEYTPGVPFLKVWNESSSPHPSTLLATRNTTYPSADGVQIPLTLIGRQGTQNVRPPFPLIMTSYGGFGVSMTPRFSVLVTILVEFGAVFALPHIRGGGEFGREWHEAAKRHRRQISFDDFLAAAQWLCDQEITTPSHFAIFGGSNSGLLVGAAMTQRPDLFGAVLSIGPLLDMVRYEQFDSAGRWREEYGSVDNPEEFQALHDYSPYHRVRGDIDYPSVLFVSGDKDDRCNPAHVRKMAARLLERDAQVHPVLVDYSEHRGHSPVLPLSIRVEALARRIAFLCRELNIPIPNGDHHDAVGP